MKSEVTTCARIVFLLVVTLALSSVTQAASNFKIIQYFACGANGGCYPSGPLLPDQSGNLYGSAEGGGADSYGVVFNLSPNPDGTWVQNVLYSFDFHLDGEGPRFGVARNGQGDLFGTTLQAGGPLDLGTVYELTPDGGNWDVGVLYDGSANAGLIVDKVGNVYGPIGGGLYQTGAIAELTPSPNGWTYTVLYSFCAQPPQCPDGQTPALSNSVPQTQWAVVPLFSYPPTATAPGPFTSCTPSPLLLTTARRQSAAL